jgi:thiopeptide-type bacteriocin biosynthesis protein
MGTSQDIAVADFIRCVAQRLETRDAACLPPGRTVEELSDLFVQGGVEALDAAAYAHRWVQRSIQVNQSAMQPLMSAVSELANALLQDGVAENFFFMRKPPGLRLRFQAARERAALEQRLAQEVSAWQSRGLVCAHKPAVYEPEYQLFGGVQSMDHVHALFTIDSLFWSTFLGRSDGETADTDAWSRSLRLLRSVFEGLAILGWEDLGVWDAVLEDTGRRLALDLEYTEGYRDLAALVREVWAESSQSLGTVDALQRACADLARQQAARWRTGYFECAGARIGPRQGAAYFTIFHWNRAGFSSIQQGLVAEALATRRERADG